MKSRAPWPALVRTLEKLLEEAKAGSMTGISMHGYEGGDLRISLVLKDPRRDVDLPGQQSEMDEDWDEDTDVNP